jgi:hypothetical protein
VQALSFHLQNKGKVTGSFLLSFKKKKKLYKYSGKTPISLSLSMTTRNTVSVKK